MARGVDIPEVHWVIQYDPPSNASSFVHRAGRTARVGKKGSSLVILMPNEDAYVHFIYSNQKVKFTYKYIFINLYKIIFICISILFSFNNIIFINFIR